MKSLSGSQPGIFVKQQVWPASTRAHTARQTASQCFPVLVTRDVYLEVESVRGSEELYTNTFPGKWYRYRMQALSASLDSPDGLHILGKSPGPFTSWMEGSFIRESDDSLLCLLALTVTERTYTCTQHIADT